MVTEIDDLFAAPDLIPEEIGCGFDGGAMAGGGVSQVDPRIAQRRINQPRTSGLVQSGSKQVARITISPLLDPQSRGMALIQEELSGAWTRVLKMIGRLPGRRPSIRA